MRFRCFSYPEIMGTDSVSLGPKRDYLYQKSESPASVSFQWWGTLFFRRSAKPFMCILELKHNFGGLAFAIVAN